MAIIARAGGRGFEPVTEGVHTAVCVWIVDLGEQYSEIYSKMSRKVMLTWEIPDETVNIDGEDKPRVISKEYTSSLSEKAVLRQHLEAWRGKKFTEKELEGFDLVNILGKSCQLQVLHNDKGYANIGGIMALPKGMTPLEPHGETVYLDLSDKSTLPLLEKIPSWIQDKIKQSETYKALISVDTEGGDFQELDEEDVSLPF